MRFTRKHTDNYGLYLIHHPSDGPPSPKGKVGERGNELTDKLQFKHFAIARKNKNDYAVQKPVVNHSRVVCRNACPYASLYLYVMHRISCGMYSIAYFHDFVNTPRPARGNAKKSPSPIAKIPSVWYNKATNQTKARFPYELPHRSLPFDSGLRPRSL